MEAVVSDWMQRPFWNEKLIDRWAVSAYNYFYKATGRKQPFPNGQWGQPRFGLLDLIGKRSDRMEKAFEKLQIKDDFMFGVIMREPKFCRPFLERILDIRIDHI